ncbi:MAG TPA: ferrichrome ABC transporter permease [Thermoanaerobaculia bacterium]
MLAVALTIFLGAFLLFQIEPLIGKYILPWFGGAPAVWTTCLLFFQLLLLAGYSYAHGLARRPRARGERVSHATLLAVSVALLAVLAKVWGSPILASASWKPSDPSHPIPRILAVLAVSVGLPYFLLATTSPLLAAWAARARPGVRVYRLYALSNLGSLLALLSYPPLVERFLPLRMQALVWSSLYAVFAAGAALCAVAARASTTPAPVSDSFTLARSAPIGRAPYVFWFLLAACGSTLLLATTNQMCQEVASIPLLWVIPLCLYLVSFILCFESDRIYSRAVFGPALAFSLGWAALVLFKGFVVPIRVQVAAYSAALFAGCMVCHGELARSRPDASRLTSFYLTIAAGGAAGGLFVAIAAPRLFDAYWEIHICLWLTGLLALVALLRDSGSWVRSGRGWPALLVLLACGALANSVRDASFLPSLAERVKAFWEQGLGPIIVVLAAAALAWALWQLRRIWWDRGHPYFAAGCLAGALGLLGYVLISDVRAFLESAVSVSRNFYGVLTVEELSKDDPDLNRFELRNGRIVHGFQYRDPEKRREPTTYYTERSGIGLALLHHPRRATGPLRVGVVGLGTGTIAAYGRAGDTYRFYDINPAVVALSEGPRSRFTYLRDCPARVEIVLGDARLSLERERRDRAAQGFDVLAIDAFTSDSIPVHLLTREAVELYFSRLARPDGILAIHISNRQLDLAPVVRALVDSLGRKAASVDIEGEGTTTWGSTWILVSSESVLETPEIARASKDLSGARVIRPWTDDYSNLFQVIK